MIDPSVSISPVAAILFHLKQGFFLYLWPMLIGFLTILGYQTMGRAVTSGAAKWPVVFLIASAVSMISLFGWTMIVRGLQMIPFYGCGVGLASAMMSRIYAVTLPQVSLWFCPRLKIRFIRVIWRGDAEAIGKLQEALRARV